MTPQSTAQLLLAYRGSRCTADVIADTATPAATYRALATVSKTVEELQKELATIDFSAIAGGDKLIVWVQEIESDAGIVELPMLKISVPMATKKRARGTRGSAGAPAKDTLVSLIVETLTEPLSKGVPEDLFTFYQLLAVLALSEGGDDDELRSTLIDSFENGGDIGVLPLLRLGKGLPYATAIQPWKENGEDQAGVHQLIWTG
jgi:hypothetical protein